MKKLFQLACAGITFSIILSAFGGHILKPMLSEYYFTLHETALEYFRIGCLGLIVFSLKKMSGKIIPISLILGSCIFSISLYAIIFFENKAFGMITPVGGTLLILGWFLMIFKD